MKKRKKRVTANPGAPATKRDVAFLMDEIAKIYRSVEEGRIDNESWKDEMIQHMDAWKKELKDHFDLVAENIHQDCIGANKDQITSHEHRINRLERHAGFVA